MTVDPSFDAMCVVTCAVKRMPAATGNPPTRGDVEAVPALAAIQCFPFDPLNAEQQAKADFERPYELRQTYTEADVRRGDVLVLDGVDYPVYAVADWLWDVGVTVREVIIHDTRS